MMIFHFYHDVNEKIFVKQQKTKKEKKKIVFFKSIVSP